MGFLLFGIIIVVFFTTSIELVINNETVLREGSQAFEWWAKPPELPMIKIYIFNVTNADEFLNNGSKPIVEELGPYVYVERWEKKNIKFHQNGTVSFNQQKIYHFDESQSSGLEDDVVVVPNIPMLSATTQSKYAARYLRLAMSSIIDILKIKPFVEVSVGQLLWGYEDPLLKLAKEVVPKEQKLPYEEFGLMYKKNGTSKDTITIFTGANDITKYGLIDKWNGKTSLEHFTTYECNSVLASDGSIFPPNITKNVTLYLFDKDLCRRLPLVFDKEVKGSNDIPAYRFTPPKNVFASVEENPDNVCFCPHGPPCTPSGFHNASLCQYDSPILLSFPHFYMGNDSYRTAFDGISPPVPENHTFYIIVQPDTGTAMAVKQRIQINLAVSHVEDIEQVENFPDIVFPIMWYEEGFSSLPKEMTEHMSLTTSVPPIAKPLPKEMTEDVSLTTSVPPIAKPLPKEMTEDVSLMTSVPPIAKPLPKEMTEDVSLTTSVPPIAKPLPKEMTEDMSLTTSVPPIAKPLPKEMTEDVSLTTSVPPIAKPLPKETIEEMSLTSVPPIAKPLPKEMTEDMSLTTSVPPIVKPLAKETTEPTSLTRSVPPIAKLLPKEMTEDVSLTTSVPPIAKPLPKETIEEMALTSVPPIAKPLPKEMTEDMSLTTSVPPIVKPLAKETTEPTSLTTSVPTIAKPLPNEMTEHSSLTTSVHPRAKSSIDFEHAVLYQNNLGFRYYKKNITSTITTTN